MEVKLTIEVRLVGFDGDGHSALVVHESELAQQLRALRADMDTVALEPELRTLVCVSVCVYVCVRVCVRACARARACVCAHTHMPDCTHAWVQSLAVLQLQDLCTYVYV